MAHGVHKEYKISSLNSDFGYMCYRDHDGNLIVIEKCYSWHNCTPLKPPAKNGKGYMYMIVLCVPCSSAAHSCK